MERREYNPEKPEEETRAEQEKEREKIAELQRKWRLVLMNRPPEFQDDVTDFTYELQEEKIEGDDGKEIDFSKLDFRQYKLFHVLIGSSGMTEKETPYFDLPGGVIEEYIEQHYEKLMTELGGKKEE